MHHIRQDLAVMDAPRSLKTLVIEDGGHSIKQLLVKSDPIGSSRCKRKWCVICKKEEMSGEELRGIRVACHKPGVGYSLECMRPPCMETGKSTAHYEGESSRSGAIRLGQQYDLY